MVNGIEQTAGAVFVSFWLVCPLEKGRILYGLDKNVSLSKVIFFSQISASYSFKSYSYKNKERVLLN